MPENTTIHIAIAFDEAYARHGGATIASVLANTRPDEQVFIHMLDNGVTAATRQALEKYVSRTGSKIEFIELDLRQFASFPTTHHCAATYSRLALPGLLPNLSQLIYLDSDVIVRQSLRPLWESCLGGRAAAVVRDAADVFGSHFVGHKLQLGLRRDQQAFNAGIMLMDLALWRERSIAAAVALWISQHADIMIHSDQDALNAVLKDQVCFLHPTWNVQSGLIRAVRYGWISDADWIAAVRNPGIVHYAGDDKPWNFQSAVPRRSDYLRFANLVGGSGLPPKQGNVSGVFQRTIAEAMEFRYWLAALVKGRLRWLR